MRHVKGYELEDWVIIYRPVGSTIPRMAGGLANKKLAMRAAHNYLDTLRRVADEIIFVGPARTLRDIPANHWPDDNFDAGILERLE